MEAQQAQPQFTPLGRTTEHQVYQDHYSQPVQTQFSEVHQPSLPAVGHQNVQLPSVPVPNMATNQAQDFTTHYHTDLSSSYNHDGFMSYSLKDGAATHEQNASVNSSQGSIPTISPSYSQEMVTNYTSVSGSLLYTLTLSGQFIGQMLFSSCKRSTYIRIRITTETKVLFQRDEKLCFRVLAINLHGGLLGRSLARASNKIIF